jgi:O-acetylserine/cysteine efflux transporter
MTPRDRLTAIAVAACWGVNFPATHVALEHFPPLFMVAVRFGLLALPTLLFVPRPAVATRWLLGYGVGFGILQFAFLYLGMRHGMPSGLASLVLQSSAPFTVVLGAALLRERLSRRQVTGVLIAVAGLTGIAVHRSLHAGLLPLVLTLCGGLGWALGNLASRQARPPKPLHLTMWMSVVPPIPMFLLSLAVEGPHAQWQSLTTVAAGNGPRACLALLYVVLIATVLGSGAWTTLMSRYPAGVVAPFSMLVPVFGLASSWLLLGEGTDAVELAFGALVVGGVLFGVWNGDRLARRNRPAVGAELARDVAGGFPERVQNRFVDRPLGRREHHADRADGASIGSEDRRGDARLAEDRFVLLLGDPSADDRRQLRP